MCESNSTEIPEWINDYKPVDKVDKQLLDLFCKLYSQSDSSKGQHRRTIQKIYQLMINKNLLKRSSHENYNEALEKNFKWAIGLKIIITYELKEKLRQYCQNRSEEPEITITNHLNNLQNTEYSTTEYKQIENYLATQIDNLLEKLKKDNTANPDYLNILQSYIIRIPRIKSFDKNLITHTHSFKDSLVSWINNNLKQRINDLYYLERQPNQIPTISLEELDSELTYNNFPQTQYNAARNTLENYLTEDPFQLLASTYIDKDNFPNLTYKVLVDRLILKEPPDSLKYIADEFGINYSNFASAEYPRSFKPTIVSIAIEIGYYSVALRQAVIDDINGELRKCKKVVGGKVVYDAQVLAQKLLPVFQQPEIIFSKVVNYLNTQGHQLRTSKIFMSNENSSFEIFFEIARELKEQGYDFTSYDVLESWKTVQIEEFSQEIQKQKYKISPPAIRYFWENKCRKCLGKLLIDLNNNSKGK